MGDALDELLQRQTEHAEGVLSKLPYDAAADVRVWVEHRVADAYQRGATDGYLRVNEKTEGACTPR